jgi:DNA-directed RNA polymerase II subunit RPB2
MTENFEPEPMLEGEPDKINLSDIKPLDVWTIIETYFRDNPNYKTQHQIDSFNEFITSDTNGIKHIIKRENPLIIYKEALDADKGKYKYQINIYYGETLTESGEISDKTKDNIFVSSPIEYIEGKQTYMYPNIARLKGYTYASSILCNIGVQFIDNVKGTSSVKNFGRINIGLLPIMIKSKMCILNDLDSTKLTELGECPYDQGGYFIIKGKEKVFLSQEKKINDILYINSINDELLPLQCVLKTVSTEGFQSSRTNTIMLNRVTTEFEPSNKDLSEVDKSYCYRVTIRILGITDFNVPLFVLFRALGMQTDKEIISTIIYDNDTDTLKSKLFELLIPSVKDSQPIMDQKSAYKLLSLHTKGKEVINVIDTLKNNLLPKYKTDIEKCYFLGYSVRKLFMTHLKIIPETERDSYALKRIDLAGSLLLELYRELWGKFKRESSLRIDKEHKFHFKEYDENISNIINEQNTKKIFACSSMDNIVKSFGAVFGTNLSARQGIVQDLNRNTMLGTLSHVRRLSNPLPSGSKSIGPRKLHNSQWGFVCPTESPDGGNVGIINHISIMAILSFNVSEEGIYLALIDHGLINIQSIIPYDLQESTKVFMNGKWIGIHRVPDFLYKIMRLLKLNSIIHLYTSISWDIMTNEIYIFTDSGRLLRPLFVLKKMGNKLSNELIEGDYSHASNWNKLIRGSHIYKQKGDLSIYDETYFKEELDLIKINNPDYIQYLEDNISQIEYIDSAETQNLFIATSIYSIDKEEYTHSEIHPSLILSAVALNIPFPEHSQYPRNVFSCQQTKQAVGVYSSAYNTRFDTFGHILNYPQKPIVTTRYKKYTDVDKLPYGDNAIVAIASYSGYNQEDAVILNKTSVERGLFNTLYYRSYEDSEEIDESNNQILFGNPNYLKNVRKSNTINYDKLDENGFVREGVYVDENDAIITKYLIEKSGKNSVVNIVAKTINFGSSGIVDKVIVYKNKDNLRTCKVRIRKNKIPEMGDKFASRLGQKGVCGMVIEQQEMPFTKDGIVPDLIVNPHAIPSRMTINQLLEVVLGKSSCMGGFLGDATAFQNTDVRDYAILLQKYGYEEWGNEIMYNGMTGDQMKTQIFIGPTYYQRIKIMVADKMHSRGEGPKQNLTRQPVGGRSNNGGGRIGEMERDSILSHGLSGFLNESVMERSDKYSVQINENSGFINYEEDNEDNYNVQMPYSMKLLLQELQCMGIGPRLDINQDIENPAVHDFVENNFKL